MGMFISVDDEQMQSFFTFGGEQGDYLMTSELYTQNSISIYQWQLNLNKAKFGDTSFLIDGYSAILDSSSPYILLPFNDFLTLSNQIEEVFIYATFSYIGQYFYFNGNCSEYYSQLPDLIFQFNTNQDFYLTPEVYLIEEIQILGGSSLNVICILPFTSVSTNQYILG
mmetsp:Transcript_28155/g.27155  ORF Transcript_28155/g.27155 Transcript_28155/m.27155 type:complete len:168 (+) Transcript_28155:616-1119(+)